MSLFKIQSISDNSIIEIIAMNIDNENNILIIEDGSLDVISLNKFKDMILGENVASKKGNNKLEDVTYKIVI